MAAHGALVSLMQILTALQLQPLDDGFFTRQIPTLTEKVSFLLDFLENSSRNTRMVASLEKSIGDAASAAEDLIVEPQLNGVLVSQLLSASRKEKSVLFHMIHMLIDNLIPALKRAKSWVAEDLMFGAATIPFFVISWVLKHLVFETAAFLFSWVVDPIMYVIEPLMFGAAKHLIHVISNMVEYLMFEAAKFLVKVISWLVGRLIVEAATYLFENVIFMGAEIVGPALIRVLLPVILKNVLSAIVKNSIYGPLMHNAVTVYHSTILLLVIRVFESIIEEVNEIIGEEEEALVEMNVLPPVFPRHVYGGNDEVVGLERDLAKIREQLASFSLKREVVSIVGMGGIGKTTLARRVHDDSYIASHFDIRAWVAVSQEYSVRNVLLGLLDSAKILTQEMQQASDEKLALYLYQNLKGRRYLIVMDDVWDTEIWDSVRRSFPDDYNRSRILLTTRLSDVALYANSVNPIHQMRFLTDDQSWTLLCQKALGNIGFPLGLESELEEIGQEIARNCRGLPLTIVVIGGLLLKENRTQANWRSIAENLNSIVSEDDEKCLVILGLSYKHLPHHLKPCFLYMGVFPEDCEIPVSKLISLWIAEGFLKPSESKSLEEVAEEHVKDLIERSLILVGKHTSIGKVKTCYIHDLLRQVCLLNGKKENFLHVVNSNEYLTQQGAKLHRRLSLHPNTLHSSCDLLTSYSLVRSFLCISKHLTSPSDFSLGFKLVRVLDIVVVQFHAFPEDIVKLAHLRYLGFNYNGLLPPSIAELKNLQTIVHQNWTFGWYSFLPTEIWRMPNLRHLYIKPSCLPDPLDDEASPLENLKSLVDVRNLRFTRNIVGRIPNVKTLGILYDVSPFVDWSEYQLESLVDLHQLEVLKIVMKNLNPASSIANAPRFAFPRNLKELTLSGCRIPWESMTVVGEMPDLRVLKLRRNACSGLEWEPVEEEFSRLEYLLLEEMDLMFWRSDKTHFPLLQRLIIRSCSRLEEIPCGIGEIPTLELIELVDCLPSAVKSVQEIQEDQESMGNDDLKIHIDPKPHFKDRINTRILR